MGKKNAANSDAATPAAPAGKAKKDKPKDVPFTRTDETLRYRWEDTFSTIKAGEEMTFEGHELSTVRERAVQFTRKTDIVLETGAVNGVPTVRRPK